MAWSNNYRDEILHRIQDDISMTQRRMELTTPGRTMPDADTLQIGAGKQMELAILFLDICGFSKQDSDTYHEQKRILAIINIFMGEMIRIIKDFNGNFEKNTGDGLMAYFGTDEPERKIFAKDTIDAAITMMYSNYKILNLFFRKWSIPPIHFRIGIDLGQITIANIGSPYKAKALVAIGATANIACRLLDAGHPGEILIGNNLRQELPGQYQQFCRRRFFNTGYYINNPRLWYPVYSYNGRWE